MKKLFVPALIATMAMAGSAFAAGHSKWKAQPNATFSFGVNGAGEGPTTTNNDDSCDISTAPAATLLLPYFEVDFRSTSTNARTTLFTITNTSALPQIAHVTVWTDWSFPALDFNIFLTGYDVQAINLYDLFNRGVIAPPSGTSSNTGVPTNPTDGSTPFDNDANPNIVAAAQTVCASLPGAIQPGLLADLQALFTQGITTGQYIVGCGTTHVGGTHTNAIGYITVDVASTCSTSLPSPGYFTGEILFDNVLIGDYQDINPNPTTGNFAGGNPMVHIRAIPEGGPAGAGSAGVVTNLPYTFYDRYTGVGARQADRRQPLPSTFAARYIQGGTGSFNTNYKIWREGFTTFPGAACSSYVLNSNIGIQEVVRFDEHENATISGGNVIISPPPPGSAGIPETSSQSTASSSIFPPLATSGDVAGWMYLNLNNGGAAVYSVSPLTIANNGGNPYAINGNVNRQSQNWVIVSMSAEGRYSVDYDSAWLGNGCSPSPATGEQIGPAGGVLVCPEQATCPDSDLYEGTNTTP